MNNSGGTFVAIETIFIDIIKNELANLLTANIWIQNQNKVIPPSSEELFVVVGMTDSKIISNVNSSVPTDLGMDEIQEIVSKENIQIDMISRDNKALLQRNDIIMALNSIYSKQQQELYNFKIFRMPTSFVNASEAEGSSQLNRFTIIIPCHTWYRKTTVIASNDYYNDFDTRVDDDGQPAIISFNIKEG